jgi:hypothetical protein
VSLGIIDNGTSVKFLKNDKWPEGFKFNLMDISLDGTKESHNKQRPRSSAKEEDDTKPTPYDEVITGLTRAREVSDRVTSLLTLTMINAGDMEAVADILFTKKDGVPLADQFNVTTMSPTNETNTPLEVDKETFKKVVWEGLKNASLKYPPIEGEDGFLDYQIVLKLYRVEDVEKLAYAIGEKKFMEALLRKPIDEYDANEYVLTTDRNDMEITIDGVRIYYLPLSIWTPEEFVIEADATHRTAYEGKFTLEEHKAKRSNKGEDITPYTIGDLDTQTNFREAYEKSVAHWWTHFGHKRLEEEMEVFKRIRAEAIEQGWVQQKV